MYMENNNIYNRMFTWLFLGLFTTFISGYSLSLNQELLYTIASVGLIPIIALELIIAVLMGFRIKKMSPLTAKICYIIYSIITGFTFGFIFIEYKLTSIISIFLASAITFGLLALYGYKTKKDLTKFSTILAVSLISMVIISILNLLIFRSTGLELILSVFGVLIFLGYIAYDMKSVKYLMNGIGQEKAAVYGAFQLYLDFINLFIRLIELFGKKKD